MDDYGRNEQYFSERIVPAQNSVFSNDIPTHNNFHTPIQQQFIDDEFRGSIQRMLSDNIGEFVVISFLIGTDRPTRKKGIIYYVGESYIILYDDENDIFIMCDLFAIKFVYFYRPGQRPNVIIENLPVEI